MAQEKPKRRGQRVLVEELLQYGQLAYSPTLSPETRQPDLQKFVDFTASTGTLELLPALNLLVQQTQEPWLRSAFMGVLVLLPTRKRGVQDTIEFVLAVHPTTSGSANAGRGSGISHEALQAASKLLSSPPASLSPDAWFSLIAPQLVDLLQGKGEPEMDRVAAFVIGFGILGHKAFGAPGKPGWRHFAESLLACIDPALYPRPKEQDTVPIIGGAKVLKSADEVALSLQCLNALVTLHPNPSLTKRLLRPILLPLWSLSRWRGNHQTEVSFCRPAKQLLQILFRLSPAGNLEIVLANLVYEGSFYSNTQLWAYDSCLDGGIRIVEQKSTDHAILMLSNSQLASIDSAAKSFVALLRDVPDLDAETSQLFMALCKRWVVDSQDADNSSVMIRHEQIEPRRDSGKSLIEVNVMQNMITMIPEKLVGDSRQVLDLVSQLLSKFDVSRGEANEEILSIALSLLNLVLASPSFRETDDTRAILDSIKKSLEMFAKARLEISSTAQNLLLLIRFRSTIDEPENFTATTLTEQQTEDRKSYALALSYLTASESPPPVRAQGLELISALVKASSSILDIPALLVLLSSLLQDGEEYIYLRVIRSFIELSYRHPRAVMKDLLERYVDPNEDSELDQRLRFGEALTQVIQNSSSEFSGETARSVCEGLLAIAGRRGRRPKTEKEQEQRDRLKQKKDKEAEDAWGGEVPQLEEDMVEENDVLAQIVSGWESKRGTEDVRIRVSALSIFGVAIEANIAGIGSTLISTAVDLSIYVLTLEPEPEKGILRRAAILLFMSFIRALDVARTEGRKLGFGLVGHSLEDVQRILGYVEGNDYDGLVRKHAGDVIESLETWKIKSMLPSQNEQTELQQLAGLSVSGIGSAGSSGPRPRIEEIE